MTSEEVAKRLRERATTQFTGAITIEWMKIAATLIESQAQTIAELQKDKERINKIEQCIEEFGELSGPPLSRRVKLILESKALLAEVKSATASEGLF